MRDHVINSGTAEVCNRPHRSAATANVDSNAKTDSPALEAVPAGGARGMRYGD